VVESGKDPDHRFLNVKKGKDYTPLEALMGFLKKTSGLERFSPPGRYPKMAHRGQSFRKAHQGKELKKEKEKRKNFYPEKVSLRHYLSGRFVGPRTTGMLSR